MRTPEQIADEAMEEFTPLDGDYDEGNFDVAEQSADFIRSVIASAVREAQRENDGTVHAAVIEALKDRESPEGDLAAEWIEGEPDEFWDEFAGPMLDDIERRFR